jgi:hypothetical protein
MDKKMKEALLDLPLLGETEGAKKVEKVVMYGSNGWTWEAYEAEEVESLYGPDIECFGLVRGFEEELGYWRMRDLFYLCIIFSWEHIKEKEVSQ